MRIGRLCCGRSSSGCCSRTVLGWDVRAWVLVPQVSEKGNELGSAPCAATLDGARRDTQKVCCLVDGVPLDVDEHERSSLLVRKCAQRSVDLPSQLATAQRVAGLDGVSAVVLRQGNGRTRLGSSQ